MRICSQLNKLINCPKVAEIKAKRPIATFFEHVKDIEIGRCVWKYLNIGCTQSVETKDLFFNNFNDAGFGYKPRIGQISKYLVRSAITFHPNKDPIWQFETYSQIIRSEIEDFKGKDRVPKIQKI